MTRFKNAIAVAGAHTKRVIARRDIAVFRRALVIRCVHPIVIPAREAILELHFFRSNKTQAGEMKFDALLAGRNFQ